MSFKCSKCGKVYKSKSSYYENHIKNCNGISISSKTKNKKVSSNKSDQINNVIIRLEKIEARLDNLEQNLTLITGKHTDKHTIKNEILFLELVKDKLRTYSTGTYGINVMPLKYLFTSIEKDYNISKEDFSKFLLKLNNNNKIQLEPATINDDFSIRDNYGNVYKIIRIIN